MWEGKREGRMEENTEERQRLIQYPLSPDLRPISINGGSWYVES